MSSRPVCVCVASSCLAVWSCVCLRLLTCPHKFELCLFTPVTFAYVRLYVSTGFTRLLLFGAMLLLGQAYVCMTFGYTFLQVSTDFLRFLFWRRLTFPYVPVAFGIRFLRILAFLFQSPIRFYTFVLRLYTFAQEIYFFISNMHTFPYVCDTPYGTCAKRSKKAPDAAITFAYVSNKPSRIWWSCRD